MRKKNRTEKPSSLYKKGKVVSPKDAQNTMNASSTDSMEELEMQSLMDTNSELVMAGDGLNRLYMIYGKLISELYQTMCNAAVKLPFFALQSDLMDVVNDQSHLSVVFHRDRVHSGQSDEPGGNDTEKHSDEDSRYYDEYDDFEDFDVDDCDIEEGLVYDED